MQSDGECYDLLFDEANHESPGAMRCELQTRECMVGPMSSTLCMVPGILPSQLGSWSMG